MIRSRNILSLAAFAAIAAWANAQAMSCCWLPGLIASAGSTTVEAAMAADHSCCGGATTDSPGASSDAPSDAMAKETSAPGCGMGESGVLAECCELADPGAVSVASTVSASSTAVSLPQAPPVFATLAMLYPGEGMFASGTPPAFAIVAALSTFAALSPSSPPVWLSVGHLLI